MQRKYFFIRVIAIVMFYSCVSKTKTDFLPRAPASIKAVQDELEGEKYKAKKAGIHRVFEKDKAIQWLEPKKEEEFEKKIIDESKSLQLNFVNDTSVTVSLKDKIYKGTYAVDDNQGEGQKPGIKLRISYRDKEFKFGDGPVSLVTYTYFIEGINNESLLLETPRGINNHKIIVLMNKQ